MTGAKTTKTVAVRSLPCPAPAGAILLPVSGYPAIAAERVSGLDIMVKFSRTLAARRALSSEMFIHITPSKNPSAGAMISRNAREWGPQIGLGVWAAHRPPTLWTKEDFADLDPGQLPRDVIYPTFRIGKGHAANEHARATMFGTGAVLEVLTPDSGPVLMQRGTDLLLPAIHEPALRGFSYYLPLLDAASIATVAYEQLQAWLCGGLAYLRESVQDGGLLVIAMEPIVPILEALGAAPDPDHPEELRLPVD